MNSLHHHKWHFHFILLLLAAIIPTMTAADTSNSMVPVHGKEAGWFG